MNKNIFVALVLSATCLSAQAADKIATIDFSAVYSHLPELKSTTDKLESELKPKVDQLKAQESTLNQKIQAFQKKANKLNPKELETQKNALEQQRAKLNEDVQSFMKQKTERLEQVRNSLVSKIKSTAKDVSKNKGYDMVVDANSVVWADDKDDLTQDVINAIK